MRVVNLLFDDRYGGPQKRVLEVARELADVGIETIMCLPHGDGNAAEIARDAGVPVRRVRMERVPNPRQFLRVARWGLLFPRDVAEYLRVLRELRPDVAHVNGAFSSHRPWRRAWPVCRWCGISTIPLCRKEAPACSERSFAVSLIA